MFSSLATLRSTLRERLAGDLPAEWAIVDHISTPRENPLTTVVYFEFTGFDSSANGQPLSRDAVAASVDVVVATGHTDDDGIAEGDADAGVLALVRAIVTADDLFFSTARKVRLDSGPYAWRLSLTALTNIAPSEGE